MSRIAVALGGPSPEHDVSVLSGLQAARALADSGHEVSVLYWSKQARWSLHEPTLEASAFADGAPAGGRDVEWHVGAEPGLYAKARLGRSQRVPFDVVVVGCHGAPGEDGHLQALLELVGVPYTGPTVREAALTMDKLAFASFAASLGLPVARRILLDGDTPITPVFDGPYVLKPRFGGSSLGVEIVDDLDTAAGLIRSRRLYADGAYLEAFHDGWYDINVAVRSAPQLVLSHFERPLGNGAGKLSYEDKYVAQEGMAGAPREVPATLPGGLQKELADAALAVGRALPVRGVMRLDFLTDGEGWVVNEINAIPGSFAKYLWADDSAASFADLLSGMVTEATGRGVGRWTSDGADGRLLRDAMSIAAKLA